MNVLGFGQIVGGNTPANKNWRTAVAKIKVNLRSIAEEHSSPLNLTAVFVIAGNNLTPDFLKTRSGSYFTTENVLEVQVPLFEPAPETVPEAYDRLMNLLESAIDQAELWMRRHRREGDLTVLRTTVAALGSAAPLSDS